MRLVISDTGPVNYLVLIGHVDVLPVLFETVILPAEVLEELSHPDTPPAVRAWAARLPPWVHVRSAPSPSPEDDVLSPLDDGERAAILLAAALQADLLLMDDSDGVKAALRKGLNTTGTIGILDRAARQGLLDLADAFDRLRRTSFHRPEAIMARVLAEHGQRGRKT